MVCNLILIFVWFMHIASVAMLCFSVFSDLAEPHLSSHLAEPLLSPRLAEPHLSPRLALPSVSCDVRKLLNIVKYTIYVALLLGCFLTRLCGPLKFIYIIFKRIECYGGW